jgi:hypothetical protein
VVLDTLVSNMTGETVQQRWERIGMLEYVPENKKERVANAFELILQTLKKRENSNEQDISGITSQYETVPFPIIRRILMKIDINDDEILEIISNSNIECKKFVEVSELKYMNYIDIECEFIADYVDNYLIKRGHKGYYEE